MTGQPNNNTSVDVESGSSAAPPNPARSMHVKFGNPTVHEVPSSHEALSRFERVFYWLIDDWIFLALLGTIMAVLSIFMDVTVLTLQDWHLRVLNVVNNNSSVTFSLAFYAWTTYAVVLVSVSAVFVHYVAPQAIGPGIPEMKTILRGVIVKEYLTFRTMLAKMVGIMLSLGGGMPSGKEGPYIHIASAVANYLSHFFGRSIRGSTLYVNETRGYEMLAAACAVGVSSTFSAPIGGVLFSIEVTSVYFAVRNYWRGFFAATCCTTISRFLRVLLHLSNEALEALYQTNFPPREAFCPEELVAFALVGFACGLMAAAFVCFQKRWALFLRRNSLAKFIFLKQWMIYPILVSFLISSLTFPKGFGVLLAGEQQLFQTARDFFSNCTWTRGAVFNVPLYPSSAYLPLPISLDALNLSAWSDVHATPDDEGLQRTRGFAACESLLLSAWRSTDFELAAAVDGIPPTIRNGSTGGPAITKGAHWQRTNIFFNLLCFLVVYFFMTILMSTLPIPLGVFAPAFLFGAAFGRGVGELMAAWWPHGVRGPAHPQIFPGIYAVVGASAFCGGVTHTVSVAVIAFELTGQMVHILPVMIAVLVANVVASYFEISIYNSIIFVKNLPYLPNIPQAAASRFHNMYVEQFMTRRVYFLSFHESTYDEARRLIADAPPAVKAFPIVDSRENMMLIGSCGRARLQQCVVAQTSDAERRAEAARRLQCALGRLQRRANKQRRRRQRHGSRHDTECMATKRGIGVVKIVRAASLDAAVRVPRPPDHCELHHRRQSVPHSMRLYLTMDVCRESAAENALPNALSSRRDLKFWRHTNGRRRRHRADSVFPIAAENDDATTHSGGGHTFGEMFRRLSTRLAMRRRIYGSHPADHQRGADFSAAGVLDLYGDERRAWEARRLLCLIDFDALSVDAAPFQLVDGSTLFKVHSLFSLLGLSRAYVTRCGRLVGVVALRDLRDAVERIQGGKGASEAPKNRCPNTGFPHGWRPAGGKRPTSPDFITPHSAPLVYSSFSANVCFKRRLPNDAVSNYRKEHSERITSSSSSTEAAFSEESDNAEDDVDNFWVTTDGGRGEKKGKRRPNVVVVDELPYANCAVRRDIHDGRVTPPPPRAIWSRMSRRGGGPPCAIKALTSSSMPDMTADETNAETTATSIPGNEAPSATSEDPKPQRAFFVVGSD